MILISTGAMKGPKAAFMCNNRKFRSSQTVQAGRGPALPLVRGLGILGEPFRSQIKSEFTGEFTLRLVHIFLHCRERAGSSLPSSRGNTLKDRTDFSDGSKMLRATENRARN